MAQSEENICNAFFVPFVSLWLNAFRGVSSRDLLQPMAAGIPIPYYTYRPVFASL